MVGSEMDVDDRGLGFAEDFGQKVDLTQRIREVLTNYPEGTTILKELIQNADDAGATQVCFCIDRRQHAAETLYNAPLAEWQGPALLAFNNSQFSEEDFESISRIGDSKKRGQAWKTGRFGVGFNSVYHLSDLPSFVSGKYVVLFDPHCKFLPRVNSSNPGKRIDFVSTGAMRLYHDQFNPYCGFGCDMEKPFEGTLFRFPLRTVQQAAVSRLSRQSYSEDDMTVLLHELYTEATSAMLFLKNVETIDIFDWKVGVDSPTKVYSCRVKSPTAELRWHRQAFSRLARGAPSVNKATVASSNIHDIFKIEFLREVCAGDGRGQEETEVFLLSQCMGGPMSRISVMARNAAKDYDIHLVPWASIAAKISGKENRDLASSCIEGRAFCFLPLPVKTGLPVHVNGYFELSSNRRDIWYGGDMDRGGKLRSDWNQCLLEDVVASAYAELILEATRVVGLSKLYEALWPCGTFIEPWQGMVRSFFKHTAKLPVLHSSAQGGKWITPLQSLFHDEQFVDPDGLAEAIVAEDLLLVRYSESMLRMLFTYCVPNPHMVLPSAIRAQLSKPGKHGGLVDRKNALVLLEYCLGDVIDDEAGDLLAGLPLIPLANGRLGVFGKKASRSLVFVCTELEYSLLARLPEKALDRSIPKRLLQRLDSIAKVASTNLRQLSDVELAQILCYLMPAEWKDQEEVEWKPELVDNHPTQEWLVLLWRYLKLWCKDLSVFKEWPLLPTTDNFLCRPTSMSKVVKGGVCSANIESLLRKLGCHILRSDFPLEHPQLSLCVHHASGPGILDAITSAALNQVPRLQIMFEAVTDLERRELREYLYQRKWYSGDQMNEARLRIFRALPIFEAYDEVDPVFKVFVDLSGPKRFLAPSDMEEALLGTEFLYTASDREGEVLTGPLGIRKLGRAAFYKWRVVGRVSKLAPDLRNRMMLAVLRELPQLCTSDPTIKEMLKQLSFIPAGSGELRAPKSLYDPRNIELLTLLNNADYFPADEFSSPDVLDMLQGLGLKTAVVPETVLQSARQVESLLAVQPEVACSQGQALLSYLELNSSKWLPQSAEDANRTIGRMFLKVSTMFQPQEHGMDATLSRFWNELITICWCPVLMHPPHPHLPWPSVGSPVAPPKLVRLQSDMWLASASMRILDGECRSAGLAMRLGWAGRPGGSVLAAQLLELGKNHVVIEDTGLGQALATAVPRIYTILNEMLGTEEMEIVKAVLEGSRWVWVGDGFANVQEVAFSGPLHLAPYLRVIPADLAVFKELLLELGVRETLTPTEFALVLMKMAKDSDGSPLNSQQLGAAIWLVQHLADLHFSGQGVTIFVPDASSVLITASDLVYNDAPWLPHSENMPNAVGAPLAGSTVTSRNTRFVHPKISNDVAERLGVRSLRRLMLAESSDSMDLGLHDAAEAFGQHEALTTRLKHIVEMYADGPGILCELVQNADDAGASEVSFLLDKSQYGKSSVLSPGMAEWQGAALYCYNNSVFTPRDLYAISRIGQDSKIEKPSAIGRFGLGFNAVYHFTDIPGFVSGGNIVMFDPHASNLPGITSSHPGLKINFVGRCLLEQFPDQFHPYLLFGCDLQKSFPGTLFRFPLRTAITAASSEIKQEAYKPEDVLSLFQSFRTSAAEALLFLRNVASVAVYVREETSQEMQLLYRIHRPLPESQAQRPRSLGPVFEFVRGDPANPIDKEQFYRRLSRTPESQLPWQCATVKICIREHDLEKDELWLISNAIGGGRAREQAVATENRARGFVPWAGIASRIRDNVQEPDHTNFDVEDGGKAMGVLEGRAFCFLPLPVKTGLPVHVNGYFELSSNRRDIWYGDDMAGGGKLRSTWNCCLLEDVAAPAYARMLAEAARELGPSDAFFSLWPTATVAEPWASVVRQLYTAVVELDLAVLHIAAGKGKWVSARKAVFPDINFPEAEELGKALADAGLALISAPSVVVQRFRDHCPTLRYLTPHLLRKSLAASKRILGPLRVAVLALKYCLSDVADLDVGEKLQGLYLLPLATGVLGILMKAGFGERFLVCNEVEFNLLKDRARFMLIDREIEADVLSRLHNIAKAGRTNLSCFTCPVLLELLHRLVPAEWRGKNAVIWTPEQYGHPAVAWVELLWKYLASSCEDLMVLSEWPLLPTSDGQLLRISKSSKILRGDGWSENMVGVLQKAHCFLLRPDISISHPSLTEYIHDASAVGVLDALLAAAGDRLQNIPHLLKSASDGELRELRSFLCQSKWFSTGHMDAVRTQILRSLPVFECYGSNAGRHFVDLPESARWLPPDGLEDGIFGESFIRVESEREAEVLTKFLGVRKLTRLQFYQNHMFLNILRIATEVRSRAMLQVLEDLPTLRKEDPSIMALLSQLPFVPTSGGAIEAPERLYDPRVSELQTLLNKQAFFPSDEFGNDSVLDVLVTLGLRKSLGRKGLLDSARSVSMISSSDRQEAQARARALLAHLDYLEGTIQNCDIAATPAETFMVESQYLLGMGPEKLDKEASLERAYSKASINSDKSFESLMQLDAEASERQFWQQLVDIDWCPVHLEPPVSGLPWPSQRLTAVAAPKVVRPKAQMWLVSATMRILDGDCHSLALASKLGWSQRPNVAVLADQLIELSKNHLHLTRSEGRLPPQSVVDQIQEVNAKLSQEVPIIYKYLQELVDSSDFMILQPMLEGLRWIWVGDSFVSARELAFDSPAHFHPYLHIVPSEIVEFKDLLSKLGVRETFEASDYAQVVIRIEEECSGRSLSSEQLTFVVRVLEALTEVLPTQAVVSGRSSVGPVLMPDASSVLLPAKDLVYNDAPWLAKSVSGLAGMRRLVHQEISNELAERLGAKSLRYLSLVDQEMTSNLPCLNAGMISDILSGYGDEDLLLFDLLEIADRCKVQKVHVIYDKREHPRQSLLQPNLGQFQGPALTVVFEGALLSTEEVCIQNSPPPKLRGHVCQYGSGLLGVYHLTELPFIVSGGCLYLFDPSGLILAGSLAEGRSAPTGSPVGKAYSLKGTDLPQRFMDQFRPLRANQVTWSWMNSTIIRMPLRTASQAMESKMKSAEEHGDREVARILNRFKIHASSALLFLRSVVDVSVTAWEEGDPTPHNLFSVRVDPVRAVLRHPFQDKKWRKFQLSSLFGGFNVPSKIHSIDVFLTEDGNQTVDKWLIVQSLGSAHTRDMALDRKYLAYNLMPVAGVAAHLSRNGVVPLLPAQSYILAPLPLPTPFKVPVTILGHFMVSQDGGTRCLFQNAPDVDKVSAVGVGTQSGVPFSAEQLRAAWNKELLACVRDSYVELLQELQRIGQDPLTSRADPPISRGLDGTYGLPPDRAYSLWPKAATIMSMDPEGPELKGSLSSAGSRQADRQCLVEWLIRPMYTRLVDLPMWKLHGGAMTKASEGMFLAPPGMEQQGMAPPVAVCDFLKAHYKVFAVPWDLTKEIESAGVAVKELTPKMLRGLLRTPQVAAAVQSITTQVELLDYCCADLHIQQRDGSASLVVDSQVPSVEQETTGDLHRSSRSTISDTSSMSSSATWDVGSAGGSGLRRSNGLADLRDLPGVLDPGSDAFGLVAGFGRAIADIGRGVLEDIGRDLGSGSSTQRALGTPLNDDNSSLDRMLVAELKGLQCPTARNVMAKLGLSELWVGSKEQQELLPSMAAKFVHFLCLERPHLAELFSNSVFQNVLRLQPFSSQVLATNLGVMLPKQWIARGNEGILAPWVVWDCSSDATTQGPSTGWLRLLWKNVSSTPEELALFAQWPLIPCSIEGPVLVRVGFRQLVFVPPKRQEQGTGLSPMISVDESRRDMPGTLTNAGEALDIWSQSFDYLEQQYPWLLPLLRRFNVPVYDRQFLDCSALESCIDTRELSAGQAVVAKLSALSQANCLPLNIVLAPTDCDALFSLFSSTTSNLPLGSNPPDFTADELDLLRLLPIYKTVNGSYVSVDQEVHCVVPPSSFMQPTDDQCLQYCSATEGGSLYQALGIRELLDHEVMARFALPGFESLNESEQDSILTFLFANWATLRQYDAVVNALKETKFVQSGREPQLDNQGPNRLFCPPELLDPENALLKQVFAAELEKFPGGQFATSGWLRILRDAGLRSATDAGLLLECARKVEELGRRGSREVADGDVFEADVSSAAVGVSLQVWTVAGMLVEAILGNFASVYGSSFCTPLSQIAFVPAERGIPSTGGAGGKRVLASYSEAVLLKDWPLAWTCAPVLARPGVVPPEFAWTLLQLRSPPPFAVVLKHLQVVGKNGGEDILARWPNVRGMRSVEDAFIDVLKYLASVWDGLSTSDNEALLGVHFIPVANGTRLAPASALYARLGMDLAPFVFELPSIYLPYVKVLGLLGMQDGPTFASMKTLLLQLERSCGYQRLNPNELRAVLRILQFLCDNSGRLTAGHMNDPAEDAVVPDDGARLLRAKACVYVDALGASLVGDIDSSRVRFVHPNVAEELCVQLGVRKLSDVVIEELDENRSLEVVDSIGPFNLVTMSEKLRSQSFTAAVWSVIQDSGDVVAPLRRLSMEQTRKALHLAADGLWFVRRLYTRFFMLPSRVDVTLKSSSKVMEDGGHRVYEFWDKPRGRVLVAEPPDYVDLPDLLAVVVSHILGSPVCLPLNVLFRSPLGYEATAQRVLRLGHGIAHGHEKGFLQQSGIPGMEVIPADAALVQCHPLRPFHAGEIVGWRSDGDGGSQLRYGQVVEDVRASAGQALYRLQVETRPGELQFVLSSNVLSFKGTAAVQEFSSLYDSATPVASSTKLPSRPGNLVRPNVDVGTTADLPFQGPTENTPSSEVPAAEVVRAVKDMLSAVGMPVGLEQLTLLEKSMSLQEQLNAADIALSTEQERADAAVKDAEAAKTAWQCRVCLSAEVDTTVVPCGHVLCQRCAAAVSRCPFCRHAVAKALRLYRP